MAIKNYMINDKWLDIAKENIVEVKSTDGVIGSVKVNGEDYGGGGGSSDFSTAEVTVVVDNPEIFTGEAGISIASFFYTTDGVLYTTTGEDGIYVENNKAKILMCGNAILRSVSAMDDDYNYIGSIKSATGNISKNGSGVLAQWVATGDGTITVQFTRE